MAKASITDVGSIHGDEYFTLKKDALIIANHLVPLRLKVWLPFNDEHSVWAEVLKKSGFDVVITNTDFFITPPPSGVQCIISNPPFSKKKQVMDRIKDLNLKFAVILPFLWLNDCIPFDYGHQVMFFRNRMHFNTPSGDLNNPRTNCFVLSNGLLMDDLIIVKDKTKDKTNENIG